MFDIINVYTYVLCGDIRVGEEFGEGVGDISTVKDGLSTEISARGRGCLKSQYVGSGHILNMDISQNCVWVGLSRARDQFDNVKEAWIH